MATAKVDMERPSGRLGWLAFAKPRQFAWKTLLLAALTLGLGLVLVSRHALAAQLYLVLLAVVHVGALGVFALRTEKRDVAPSWFGLLWRSSGFAAVIALLTLIRLQPDSPVFWPALGTVFVLHTAGLSMLHVRAAEGARCPFLPARWQRTSNPRAAEERSQGPPR